MNTSGRKRPGEFDNPGGPEGMPPPDGLGDESFRKKAKFDNPDELDAPPATLRVLIRNSDAGGIIGKVGTRAWIEVQAVSK